MKFLRAVLPVIFLSSVACATSAIPEASQTGAEIEQIYLKGPVDAPSLNRHIVPLKADPDTVSSDVALSVAAEQMSGFEPKEILFALVGWNGRPVWVVTYEGGSVCQLMPIASGPDVKSLCAGNAQSVRVDALTGAWVDTFGDGAPIPADQLPEVPLPTMEQVLAGQA